ncbi:HAMP domain-containing sensor histidine kinase [Nonomuraea sp. NPDC046570]|uniref:sensor histidine kinase n=1 Tax=Nonomuraea sp. NPDC046570 TaxID=3155255 RepID=UPI0033F45F48
MLTNWSVRRRLTMLATVISLAVCLLGGTLITALGHLVLTEYATERVAGAARRITYNVERLAPDGIRGITTTEQIDLIQVVDEQGRVQQASLRLVGDPPLTTAKPPGDDGRVDGTICTTEVPGERCLIMVGFRVRVEDAYWMVYAFTGTIPWYIHPLYLPIMGLVTLLIVGLITWITSLTAGKALRPVKTIKNELAEITTTDLGRRVPPTPHRDEIGDLALTVNQTLDRLEAAVEQQRRFASDASHDLRSPITAMRAQVEEAMLHPEDADWNATGEALLSSLDRLQAIVSDLLTLAKLDAGAPGAKEPVDLAELTTSELARRQVGKRIVHDLAPGVVVTGDRLRLARLLTNLLDNAERHAETTITVTVARGEEGAVLEVQDDGAGIAAEQREAVFHRFTRLDASRNRDAGGTGLGLPIAREIAQAHGGTLWLADSGSGARFVLHLPLRNSYHE